LKYICKIDGKQKIDVRNFNFYYGSKLVLKDLNFCIKENTILALIGPSGSGKTTLARCFNRMHDLYTNNRYEGEIFIDNTNILDPKTDLIELRDRVGMVFQKPTAFPMSIFENIAFGLKLKGIKNKTELKDKVEKALKDAALWDEVKDRLDKLATNLSGGQQQRLCIARAIAVDPEVLVFDESTASLDPISTSKIEDLMVELSKKLTIIAVTHNLQQAARVSEYTLFLLDGEAIEYDKTNIMFTNPKNKKTQDYIMGRFG